MPTNRRELLRQAAALAAPLWLPNALRAEPKLSENPFTLGVASGSPTDDSVVLWTRLALPGLFGSRLGKAPISVRWEVATDEAMRQVVRRGDAIADEALAHSVHVELAGLQPDRRYWYRFRVGDALSPVGATRTLPSPGASPARLKLAYASCQRWEHGYFSAWRHMLADEPDLVLFLGDYLYEYPGAVNPARFLQGGWLLTLDDYRERYALYRGEPELQAMHAACPWLLVWDDHEVQNDYAGDQRGDSGPVVEDFAARRAAAYQAWYEHMPVRSAALARALGGSGDTADWARGAGPRIHQRLRFGQLADLCLLDTRQFRNPQACNPGDYRGSAMLDPGTCPNWLDPNRSLLGAEQEAWLSQAFASARGVWTIIGQQTLFGQRDYLAGPGERVWNDGWDGYPMARQRFIDGLQRHRVANPVLLGGDIHENWVGHLKADYRDPGSANLGVEFCGTSITSRAGGSASPARRAQLLAENPHFIFAENRFRGYGIAEFTARRLRTQLRVLDDPARREASISTLASFQVEAGRAVIERE